MAVKEDMDICLNITGGFGSNNKQTTDITNDMRVKKQKVNKKDTLKTNFKKSESMQKNPKGYVAGANQRVKQKSLAAIVANKLKKANLPTTVSVASILKKSNDKSNKINSDIQSKAVPEKSLPIEEKRVSFSAQKDNDSSETFIKFTKPTKENTNKSIFAKKRKFDSEESKKSLSSIFNIKESESTKLLKDSGNTNEEEKNIFINKKQKVELNQNETKTKDRFAFDKDRFSFDKDNSFSKKLKKSKDKIDRNKNNNSYEKPSTEHQHSHQRGKISSLFGHNPPIPNIGQRFVKPVDEKVFTAEKFSELGIHAYSVANLEQNMKITTMTTVQKKAIPVILSNRDVLIRSQTGSGKTLSYALPIIENLQSIRPKLTRDCGIRALVILPTRELALQTYECFLKLIKPFTWIVPGYLTGGEKRKAEKARLRKGCQVLVGTPGRLLDHIKHTKALRLDTVKYLVLDEADRMLDMGYERDVRGIVSALENVTSQSDDSGYNPLQMLRQHIKPDSDGHGEGDEATHRNVKKYQQKNTFNRKPLSDDSEYNPLQMLRKNIKPNCGNAEKDIESDNDLNDFQEEITKSKVTKKQYCSDSEEDEDDEQGEEKEAPSKPETVEKEETSDKSQRRQTILLSATLTHSVEKLAGLTMNNPVFVDAAKENVEATGGSLTEINEDLIVPQSVTQTYIVTPPKLRMVTLSAYIAGKCQSQGSHKILVFMATQDMLDYHTDVLSTVLSKPIDEEDEDSDPLVDVEFFKLHGSMTQKERTDVFKTFRQANSGVLFCTDVAARGLDLPKVDTVIQYTGPTSTRDYVHRIGRTARAGCSGTATIFLTPPEVQFVRILESHRIRIQQEDMDDVLSKLLGPLSPHRSVQVAAIALQNEIENLVLENKKFYTAACKAYTSWVRFYSSYPREMREVFNRKDLHLGHYAKSFGLRDPPQKIGGVGKNIREKEEQNRPKHQNRLSNQREEQRRDADAPRKHQQLNDKRIGMLKNVRMLNTSEFDSGLEPVKKPKKS